MVPIILAAGIGRRLYPYTKDKPKTLVTVNGITFLENILMSLLPHKDKISKVLVVVGYKKEMIIDRFGENYNGIKIKYVVNDIYDKTNNIYSLAIASDCVKEDVLLFESDVFFEHQIINEFMQETQKGENIAVVSKYQPWMRGSVVTIENSYISGLINSKDAKETNIYKTLNIYYFTNEFFNSVYIPMLKAYMQTHSNNHYYEIVLNAIIHLAVFKVKPLIITGRKWYEIDDYNDLEKAEFLFKLSSEQLEVVKRSWGGYWNYEVIDYNMICNSFYPNEELFKYYSDNLQELIKTYPSSRAVLNRKLAHALDKDEDDILISNGASEAIKLLMPKLKKPLVVMPTFGEFYRCGPVDRYNLKEEEGFKLDLKKLREQAVKNGNRSIVIVNPNNPTSQYKKAEDIELFIKRLPKDIAVVLDISFVDFIGDSYEIDYKRYKNLILIKSLSKCFGVPGLRIGYLETINHELLKSIEEKMPIWSVNSFAEYLLDDFHKFKPAIQQSYVELNKEKERFAAELESLELKGRKIIRVIGKDANFLFCRLDKKINVNRLSQYLFDSDRIVIKDCSEKVNSPQNFYLRLNVQTPDWNQRFIASLRKFLHNTG